MSELGEQAIIETPAIEEPAPVAVEAPPPPVLVYFVARHLPGGGSFVSYEGMTQDTITAMLGKQGVDFDFVTEDEYNTFVAANSKPLGG